MLFKPPTGLSGHDHYHLGPVGFPQPLLQCLADPVGAQILVFYVDDAAGGCDAVQIEPLDLPHGWLVPISGHRTGHRHFYLLHIRVDAGGPGGVSVDIPKIDWILSRGAGPTFSCQAT